MARCLLCKEEIDSVLAIGEHTICVSCEKEILHSAPKENEYKELLSALKPLSKMILASFEKIKEGGEEREKTDGK